MYDFHENAPKSCHKLDRPCNYRSKHVSHHPNGAKKCIQNICGMDFREKIMYRKNTLKNLFGILLPVFFYQKRIFWRFSTAQNTLSKWILHFLASFFCTKMRRHPTWNPWKLVGKLMKNEENQLAHDLSICRTPLLDSFDFSIGFSDSCDDFHRFSGRIKLHCC